MTYKYPNVSFDFGNNLPDNGNGVTLYFHPVLGDLIDELAVKYAGWQFVGVEGRYSNDAHTEVRVTRVQVLNDENPRVDVGTIRLVNRHHRSKGTQLCYSLYNRRIADSRERGHTVITMDKKLALKTVANFFTPVPVMERLTTAHEEARRIVARTYQQLVNRLNVTTSSVFPYMQQYIEEHWEDFMKTVPSSALPNTTEMQCLQDEIAQLEPLRELNKFGRKLLTVLIEHDKYTVLHNSSISVWDADALPTEVRQSIGMLKLSESNKVVPDVGVRVGNNIFHISVPDAVWQ